MSVRLFGHPLALLDDAQTLHFLTQESKSMTDNGLDNTKFSIICFHGYLRRATVPSFTITSCTISK